MNFQFSASVQWLFLALVLVAWSPHASAQEADDVRTGVVKVTSHAEGQQQRTGAGFIVRVDSGSAYVVTASHVVEGDPQPMVSFFAEPNRLVSTKVVGIDPTDPKGLAVLMVSTGVPAAARALPIDTASDYRGGTSAVVVGFPLTLGTGWSVIPATIDGLKGRDLVLTAPLEAGDSGGPIIVAGKVVGAVVETRGQFGFGVPAVIVQLSLQGWRVFRSATGSDKRRPAETPQTPVEPQAKADSGAGAVLQPRVTVATRAANEPMSVSDMAVSADGSALLIGGEEFHKKDGSFFGRASLTLWDLPSGRMLRSLIPTDVRDWARVGVLALSRDGTRAIVDGRTNFMLYDTRTPAVIREFRLDELLPAERSRWPHRQREGCWGQNWEAIALALSGDGNRALSSDDGCMLRLWDADSGKVIWEAAALGPIESVAFSPDERFVLSGGQSGWDGKDDTAEYSGYPNLRDAKTGRLIRNFTADLPELANTVSVAFSPDGRFAVSHTKPKGIVLWDIASGKLLRVLIGQAELGDDRDNYFLRFSHDARYLLAGCLVHDLHSGRTTQMLRGLSYWKPCGGPLASLPGGNYAVYPGEYGYGVQVHEFTTGKHVASLITLGDGEWMTITSESYYVASAAGEKRLSVHAGGATLPIDGFRSTYGKADEVIEALAPLFRSIPTKPDPAVELGMTYEDRVLVQRVLTALGHGPEQLDGRFGPNTRQAIATWQRVRGDEASGFLTERQLGALRKEAETQVAVGLYDRPQYKPGDQFRDCGICPEMVVVPGGTFIMGSPEEEEVRSKDEAPQHEVTIQRFAIGRSEVTFEEWDACVAAGGCSTTPGDQGWGRGQQPVINVSWGDAQEYVGWLKDRTGETYRLPSEAEWEYAARAGTSTPFWTGATISTEQANYDGRETYGPGKDGEIRDRTTPVNTFRPNPWGLHDMHGNVLEWVEDCWNEGYEGAPEHGAAWREGDCTMRVVRGGSWKSPPWFLRSAWRMWDEPLDPYFYPGFRVARTLTP